MLSLEDQLAEEVGELPAAAEHPDQDAPGHKALPEDLERREWRLEKIREAKAQIEKRTAKRYEQEIGEYEQRMAGRSGAGRGHGVAAGNPVFTAGAKQPWKRSSAL